MEKSFLNPTRFVLGDEVYYQWRLHTVDQMEGNRVTRLRAEGFILSGNFDGEIYPADERTAEISELFAKEYQPFRQFRFANIPDIINLITTYWHEVLAEDDAFPFKRELALKNITGMVEWLTKAQEHKMFGIRLIRP